MNEDLLNLILGCGYKKMSDRKLSGVIHELREIEPLIRMLNLDISKIKKRDPIDFELYYNGKKIALEVTDVRPYLEIYKNAKGAIENIVKGIIRDCISNAKIRYFQIDVVLKGETYGIKKLKDDNAFKEEVQEFLYNGSCENPKYIESFCKKEYPDDVIPKEELSVNFQYEGFQSIIPIECIYAAINKKEAKLFGYKKKFPGFDEYWLCIGLPFEERSFTIKGVNWDSEFTSEYQRVFLTQEIPPAAIILYDINKGVN